MLGEQSRFRTGLAAGLVVLISIVAATAAEPQPSSGDAQHLSGAAGLRPFFSALAAVENRRGARPVRIIQIGDSHTANDAFSGRLRERLQARFGAAGRGWMPAGIPFKYYRPALVAVSESGWRHVKAGEPGVGAMAGLDAAVVEAAEPGATMTATSTEPEGFDRIAVEYITRPGGKPLTLRIDNGAVLAIPTAARAVTPRRFEKLLPHPAHQLELTARDSGQAVLGWSVERHGPGVVYENHGTIGATVALLEKLSPATVAFELADRRPALLVVAFGTNEGFGDALDPARYTARFRASVADLQKRARNAAILILGPPDGNRQTPACAGQSNAANGCGEKAGDNVCEWHEPPHLAAVRNIQRRIAAEQGWAFWDWSAAMGGACSIDRWLRQDPPLAMADHVHLNKAGYTAIADLLFGELMRTYETWRRAPAGRR